MSFQNNFKINTFWFWCLLTRHPMAHSAPTGLLYDEVFAKTGSHVATRRTLKAAELQARVNLIQDHKDAANEAIIQAELVQDLRVSRFAGPPTLKHVVARANGMTHDERFELSQIRSHNLDVAKRQGAEAMVANSGAISSAAGHRSSASSVATSRMRLPQIGGASPRARPGSASSSASTRRPPSSSPRVRISAGVVDLDALREVDDDQTGGGGGGGDSSSHRGGPTAADLARWDGPGTGPMATSRSSRNASPRMPPRSARSVGTHASHLSMVSKLSLSRTRVHWAEREDVAKKVRRSFRNGRLDISGLNLGTPPLYLFNTFTIALNPIAHLSMARNGMSGIYLFHWIV